MSAALGCSDGGGEGWAQRWCEGPDGSSMMSAGVGGSCHNTARQRAVFKARGRRFSGGRGVLSWLPGDPGGTDYAHFNL